LVDQGYPDLFNESQVQLGYSTAMRYASESDDDTLAYFTLSRLLDAIGSTPQESGGRRRALVSTLIEQVRTVRLRLLPIVLERVRESIRQEDAGEGKEALVHALFSAISEGIDATKRGDAVSWWLENVDEL
jgi:hypothetical protein